MGLEYSCKYFTYNFRLGIRTVPTESRVEVVQGMFRLVLANRNRTLLLSSLRYSALGALLVLFELDNSSPVPIASPIELECFIRGYSL